jgi:hypothetical protein
MFMTQPGQSIQFNYVLACNIVLGSIIYIYIYIELILSAALALGSTQPLTEMSTRNL